MTEGTWFSQVLFARKRQRALPQGLLFHGRRRQSLAVGGLAAAFCPPHGQCHQSAQSGGKVAACPRSACPFHGEAFRRPTIFRLRSRCDTTTPCAQMQLFTCGSMAPKRASKLGAKEEAAGKAEVDYKNYRRYPTPR
eukprot:4189385-Amphidinium_carterae.1